MNSKKFWIDPEKFNPDRFLCNGKYEIPNEAFQPFSVGNRKCPGDTLAMVKTFIIFTRLLQKTMNKTIEIKTDIEDCLQPDRKAITFCTPNNYEIKIY